MSIRLDIKVPINPFKEDLINFEDIEDARIVFYHEEQGGFVHLGGKIYSTEEIEELGRIISKNQ